MAIRAPDGANKLAIHSVSRLNKASPKFKIDENIDASVLSIFGWIVWKSKFSSKYPILNCAHVVLFSSSMRVSILSITMLSILRKNVISNLTDTNGKPSHYILRVTATFSLSDDRLYIRHIKKTHHYVNDHFQEIYQADETLWLCRGNRGCLRSIRWTTDNLNTIISL